MDRTFEISEILSAVGKALLDKGAGYSVGQLVAELEGDGLTYGRDPFHVWDEHFYNDVKAVDGWPDDPRPIEEVDRLLEAFEAHWMEEPSLRFCQIVCIAHTHKNGLADFDHKMPFYKCSLDELTDDQLLDFLIENTDGAPEDL